MVAEDVADSSPLMHGVVLDTYVPVGSHRGRGGVVVCMIIRDHTTGHDHRDHTSVIVTDLSRDGGAAEGAGGRVAGCERA